MRVWTSVQARMRRFPLPASVTVMTIGTAAGAAVCGVISSLVVPVADHLAVLGRVLLYRLTGLLHHGLAADPGQGKRREPRARGGIGLAKVADRFGFQSMLIGSLAGAVCSAT